MSHETGDNAEPLPIANADLPDSRPAYVVSEAMEITARAIFPGGMQSDSPKVWMGFAILAKEHLKLLDRAIARGAVHVLNPTFKTPLEKPSGEALKTALIPRDELQRFAKQYLRINLGVPLRLFNWAARAEVDAALLALDPGEQIDIRTLNESRNAMERRSAGSYVAELRDRIARQANGFFTVEEAARLLADSLSGADAIVWRAKIYSAWQAGELAVRDGTRTKKALTDKVHDYIDLVKEADLDNWLIGDGGGCRFPRAAPAGTPSPVQLLPPKSPRENKPWETLPEALSFIPGIFMYEQAAREIADAEGWDDSRLEAFQAEMANAVNDGSLPIRSRKTGFVVPPDALDTLPLVTVDDVNEWLERKRVPYRWKLQSGTTRKDATDLSVAPAEELDYSLLATPAELLDAFGKWGMQAAWFDDLNSRHWLLDSRRRKGQGQRGHVMQPLFCPFEVMNGLIGKVRKAKRVQPETAWRTLEHKFPKVHAKFESYDPRERTGD